MKNLSLRFTFSFIVKSLTFAALILSFNTSSRAVGTLDSTFGTNGRVAVEIGSQAFATATVVQPDGKIIVVGEVNRAATQNDVVLVRFNPNGTLDTSFGEGGKVFAAISPLLDKANAVALAPDGRIVVAGFTRTPGTTTEFDFFIARFTASGGFDADFGINGVTTINQGSTDGFYAVAVQSDGKIVAAGSTSNRAAVARFNSNGSLDGTFSGGLVSFDVPNYVDENFSAMALLANGRILVGGLARYSPNFPVPYVSSNILVLLESNGSVVQSFGNQGVASSGLTHFTFGFDLAVLSDGKILTTGANTARFLSNGAVDSTFAVGGVGSRIAVRSDGKFVVVNHIIPFIEYTSLHGNDGGFVGQARNLGGNDVAVQPDDKILLVDSTATEFVVTRLVAITSQATRIADYDNDDKTDVAVLRQSNSTLYVSRSSAGFIGYNSGEASLEVRRVIPERFTNQLPFVYWRSAGNILGSPAAFCATNGAGTRQCVQWGMLGDIPVGGDYDGDRFTDYTVFRPSNGVWYIRQSSGTDQFTAVQWGTNGDKPVPADYDYDGVTDTAVYRPSTGTWWIRRSSDGTHFGVQFGAASDIPLSGDYDGDGRADFVVFRPSNGVWYQFLTTDGFKAVHFGFSTDIPVPGDYDGDGRHDIAVFRQGIWYLLQSTEGSKAVQFGAANDVPVSVRYDE